MTQTTEIPKLRTVLIVLLLGVCLGGIAASCGLMASVFLVQGMMRMCNDR